MNPIEKYFGAEKSESVLFVLVGVAAIAVAAWFVWKVRQPFYQGMAYPLVAVALIQIVVGTTVYLRSPKDLERVSSLVANQRAIIQQEEIPRMEVVMRNFVMYRWIEIGLLAAGLLLFFMMSEPTTWKGVGLGLSIQAAFMLLLDFFAESRGRDYLAYLQQLMP